MSRPSRLPSRPDSVITSVMALRRAVGTTLAIGAQVVSIGLICAACSATKTAPSGPTAPDAARADADASSPGETHRTDAGRTHGTRETSSLTSDYSETFQSIDDSGTRPDAAEPQTTQPDATGSGTTGLGSNPDSGSAGCPIVLDESVAEHACFHTSYGPFAALAAATDTAVGEIAQTHTTYTITLPDATSAGVVSLRVPRTGLYAMFSDVALPLVVNDGPDPLAPTHEQSARGCAEFAEVAVYALEAGRRYTVWLGPGATHVQLVFEQTYPDALREVCEQTDVSRDSGTTSGGETSSVEATSTTHTVTSDSNADASTSATATATVTEATTASMSSEAGTCGVLKSACLTADECCSGRCFARQCVLLECRTDGYCENDDECCSYCHFGDSPHCH